MAEPTGYVIVPIEQAPMGSGGLCCRTCKHWGTPGTAKPDRADCERADESGLMYAFGYDDAALITNGGFACVEYEPKGKADD